jgi:hypothetical protein
MSLKQSAPETATRISSTIPGKMQLRSSFAAALLFQDG